MKVGLQGDYTSVLSAERSTSSARVTLTTLSRWWSPAEGLQTSTTTSFDSSLEDVVGNAFVLDAMSRRQKERMRCAAVLAKQLLEVLGDL